MTYPLALQLYTIRHVSDDHADLIQHAAEAGYAGVEGGYGPDLDAERLKDVLAKNDIKMVSAHVALDHLENDLDGAIKFHKTLGNNVLVLPWLDDSLYSDDKDAWQALSKRFQPIAEKAQDQGVSLLYHNHSFEFGTYDGKLGLEYLLDEAPALGLELDLGWCQEGGVDPYPLLKKYSGRVKRIHVKDRASEGENTDQGGWADVGSGVIDFPPLLEAAKKVGAEWFIVEHDEPKEPLQSIRNSYDYLAKL